MRVQKIDTGSASFGRKYTAAEMKVCTKSMDKGLSLLGKKLDLILHNSSAPAVKAENVGIGSLFSRTSLTKLFPFLRSFGFSGIQQEPNEFRQSITDSPYSPEAGTKNHFMIPLEKLASDEYNNVLSKKTFDTIVEFNPNSEEVDYPYVRKAYDTALKEAYGNSKESPEFLKYKQENEGRIEQSAIYHILNKTYNGETWTDLDKRLYAPENKEKAAVRISEIKEKHSEEYNRYIYQQMILDKETKNTNEIAEQNGIKIIGDAPVAQTSVDEWVHQDLFLPGKAIGCPPERNNPLGQRWGFKYYDPEKIFNKDGSLGEAGEVLKKKYEIYFESFPGGIRIDHLIGLIDPFIYTVASHEMNRENSGRIFSTDFGRYQKHSVDEYANILEKIVLPAAEKFGISKEALICEDLGDVTKPVAAVIEKLDLGGISVTEFGARGANAKPNTTIMLGSHDNKSFLEHVEGLMKDPGKFWAKTWDLAVDTARKGSSQEEIMKNCQDMRDNKLKFIAASFAELFTSPAKRVQIFFTDFWGISKRYNTPGTQTGNWQVRAPENFEDAYYRAVSEGTAPNLPQAVATALRQRGLDKGNEDLMKDLDTSAQILNIKG